MRIAVPHARPTAEVVSILDARFQEVFTSMPIGAVKISDQRHAWSGSTMQFSCNANPGFMKIPVSGSVAVEESQVVVDLELPSFVSHFVSDEKIERSVASAISTLLA